MQPLHKRANLSHYLLTSQYLSQLVKYPGSKLTHSSLIIKPLKSTQSFEFKNLEHNAHCAEGLFTQLDGSGPKTHQPSSCTSGHSKPCTCQGLCPSSLSDRVRAPHTMPCRQRARPGHLCSQEIGTWLAPSQSSRPQT